MGYRYRRLNTEGASITSEHTRQKEFFFRLGRPRQLELFELVRALEIVCIAAAPVFEHLFIGRCVSVEYKCCIYDLRFKNY